MIKFAHSNSSPRQLRSSWRSKDQTRKERRTLQAELFSKIKKATVTCPFLGGIMVKMLIGRFFVSSTCNVSGTEKNSNGSGAKSNLGISAECHMLFRIVKRSCLAAYSLRSSDND